MGKKRSQPGRVCVHCRHSKTRDKFSPAVWTHGAGPCFECVSIFRELLRNYRNFLLLYEQKGIDLIHGPLGQEYALWDVTYIIDDVLPMLPERQGQAILWFLVENHREMDVALMMGLSPTNPIGIYATWGIEKIITWIEEGKLERFRPASYGAAV